MEKKDLKANCPRNGDGCYVNTNNITEEQHLIGRREQQLIEDKGEIKAATAMADAEMEPPAKKGWGGWWACALLAAVIIGLCLYFATRDSDIDTPRTAQVTNSGSQLSSAGDGSEQQLASNAKQGAKKVVLVKKVIVPAKAGTSTAIAGNNAAAGSGVLAQANEAFATEASIDKASAQAASVDYIYYFGNDKSAVADNKLLDEIAEKASETGADITIVAYASETGSPAYNEKLTEMRASNLADYLEAHGVSADHIKIKAGGQTDQYGGSYTLNRRADILVDYAG